MIAFIRRMLGFTTVATLALVVAAGTYVVLVEYPTEPVFSKLLMTAIMLAVTSIAGLCSSLTLGTRYIAVGILGLASASLSTVTSAFSIWSDPAASSIPSSPADAITSYGGLAEGTGVGTGFTLAILLASLMLPIINVTLYFGYEGNTLSEVLGLVTVVSIVTVIILTATAAATTSIDSGVMKWQMVLVILATSGVFATPAACAIGSRGNTGKGGGQIHFDIPAREPEPDTSYRRQQDIEPEPLPDLFK